MQTDVHDAQDTHSTGADRDPNSSGSSSLLQDPVCGMSVSARSWSHVLSYDMAIRKKAFNLMADGAGNFLFCLKNLTNSAH
jgi:hypothetical protein